ncbi:MULTISPECIES: VanZ family protein [unclassified Shouchella]|uniref:VanZ family protein n=1 Tax=unclassified Shouchella TaxID=2893065 RepID=UPI0039A2087D
MFFSIFYIYLLYVFRFTQLPIFIETNSEFLMSYSEIFQYNLIYMPSIYEMTSPAGILNILLFNPFGFGLGFLIKVNFKKIIFLGFSLSLLIELLQFLNMMLTRLSYRTVNVNDLINNTLGAVIGFILFIIFIKIFKKIVVKHEIPLGRITKHIYEAK